LEKEEKIMKKFIEFIRIKLFHRKKDNEFSDTMKKRIEIVTHLKQLKSLFVQIENSLPNRKERKAFRRRFINEDRVGGDIIQRVIKNYEGK